VTRRRHDDLDFILAQRGRKKKRSARIKRRRRAGLVVATFTVGMLVVLLTLGLGAGAALSQGCNLNSLRAVQIGQNSFVYARDGSLLGSIPAERNREPVPLGPVTATRARRATGLRAREDRRDREADSAQPSGRNTPRTACARPTAAVRARLPGTAGRAG